MYAQAYQNNQETSSPREIEYQVFGKVTKELIEAKTLDSSSSIFIQAVHRNRELWSILMNDCASPENTLPGPVKTAVVSLSLWVDSYSSRAIQESASLDPLIEVNQTIMKGLASQGAEASADAGKVNPVPVA